MCFWDSNKKLLSKNKRDSITPIDLLRRVKMGCSLNALTVLVPIKKLREDMHTLKRDSHNAVNELLWALFLVYVTTTSLRIECWYCLWRAAWQHAPHSLKSWGLSRWEKLVGSGPHLNLNGSYLHCDLFYLPLEQLSLHTERHFFSCETGPDRSSDCPKSLWLMTLLSLLPSPQLWFVNKWHSETAICLPSMAYIIPPVYLIYQE